MAKSTLTTRIQLKSWKRTFAMRLRKSHQVNWQKLPETCWNLLSCVFKFMVNSFSTSCELLNGLHVILNNNNNNNNVPYCTILYSVLTMNDWMFCMLLIRRGLFYLGYHVYNLYLFPTSWLFSIPLHVFVIFRGFVVCIAHYCDVNP